MAVERTEIGEFENQSVEQLPLENPNGVIARFINYGATLTTLQLPTGAGESVNVTLGYDHLEGYVNGACFFGCMVGRFANRIAGGRFSLAGQTFTLPCNENGINTLHGGDRGLDKIVWDSESTTIDGDDAVRFQCQSPDGDQGFPGNLAVAVTCVLTNRNELVVSYEAETDQPTPVNLTNHAYWNLAGAGNGNVLDHRMTIPAAQYLPVDDNSIPISELRDVAGTPMDFTEAHTIGERIGAVAGGYDHCYVRLGEHDRDSYGESGRCSRRAVTDEPVACVGRGNGNTHTDGDGCRWGHDIGCHGDVGYVEFIGCDGIVCGSGDCYS